MWAFKCDDRPSCTLRAVFPPPNLARSVCACVFVYCLALQCPSATLSDELSIFLLPTWPPIAVGRFSHVCFGLRFGASCPPRALLDNFIVVRSPSACVSACIAVTNQSLTWCPAQRRQLAAGSRLRAAPSLPRDAEAPHKLRSPPKRKQHQKDVLNGVHQRRRRRRRQMTVTPAKSTRRSGASHVRQRRRMKNQRASGQKLSGRRSLQLGLRPVLRRRPRPHQRRRMWRWRYQGKLRRKPL